jgi:hypothetical protein
MGDYQGLHRNVPYARQSKRIPRGEVWVRKDIRDRNPRRARRIAGHEMREARLMEQGMPYNAAHRKAGYNRPRRRR